MTRPFSSFWSRSAGRRSEAYANQDYPFDLLVESLKARRDLSRHPIFNTMFGMQRSHFQPWPTTPEGDGLTAEPVAVPLGRAKFDLNVGVTEEADGLVVELEYNADLFDGATIQRLAEHFETLLAGIAADASRSVLDLPLLDDTQRARVLDGFNAGRRHRPVHETLDRRISAQARAHPHRIAVVADAKQLSYAALDAAAGRLAEAPRPGRRARRARRALHGTYAGADRVPPGDPPGRWCLRPSGARAPR